MNLSEYKKRYTEEDAVGWMCIDAVLDKIYGTQEPKHFASVPHYALGGENPLDGISVYKSEAQESHLHFITYGFSDLYYSEESVGNEFSKYGFELSFRLKQKDDNIDWACNFIQNIAKYVFSTNNYFEPLHVMPSNSPIRLEYPTDLVAVAFFIDSELGVIDTPHGEVQFLQMVGLTSAEYEDFKLTPYFEKTESIIEQLKINNALLITDLDRK
jgi:hypothetical protein